MIPRLQPQSIHTVSIVIECLALGLATFAILPFAFTCGTSIVAVSPLIQETSALMLLVRGTATFAATRDIFDCSGQSTNAVNNGIGVSCPGDGGIVY